MGGFNFSEGENVIMRTRLAIAVYENENGDLVIRQEGGLLSEDDSLVIFPFDDVDRLIDALTNYSDLNWSRSELK